MILEIKALMTVIAMVFLAIVISQVILANMLLGFLLFVSLGLYVFGDIMIGWMIVRTHANLIIDKPPPNKVVGVVCTITGLLDFVWATKKPYGKREFVYNKEEASVIDKGDCPVHFLNGSYGFVCHESCDENLNFADVKYAEELSEDTNSDSLKEIYNKIKLAEKAVASNG